jgi:hypothetical protein
MRFLITTEGPTGNGSFYSDQEEAERLLKKAAGDGSMGFNEWTLKARTLLAAGDPAVYRVTAQPVDDDPVVDEPG